MNRIARTIAMSAAVAMLASSPASAANWGFKMWAATTYVAPLSETEQNLGGVTAAVKASNEMGYQFGLEFRGGLFGFAFDYLHARQDLEHQSAGLLGTAAFEPVSATLHLHMPTPVLQLYAGPTVSYVNWGDLDLRGGGTRPMDAKLGYGISVGGDMPIARTVAVTGGLRWLRIDAKADGLKVVAVDPLISHIGLALRF